VATLQREGILQAATRLFSEKGYRGTSMRDLGQALGLHAGSLYVHIKSKEEVLFEICDRIQRVHTEGMAEILASEAAASGPSTTSWRRWPSSASATGRTSGSPPGGGCPTKRWPTGTSTSS
jgi:AcrR family transcriptional regulator